MYAAELRELRKAKRIVSQALRSQDPLSSQQSARGRGRATGGGRGGRRGGRGRGRGAHSCGDRASGSGGAPVDPMPDGAPEVDGGVGVQDDYGMVVAALDFMAGPDHFSPDGDELEGLPEDVADELMEAFAPSDEAVPSEGADGDANGDPVPGAAELYDAAAEAATAVGLEPLAEDTPGGMHEVGEPSGSIGPTPATDPIAIAPPAGDADPLAPPPPLLPAHVRHGCTIVGPAGYVYKNGRSVLRIIRNKPVGNWAVRCYQHGTCSFLVNNKHPGTDDEIMDWCFSEPPCPDGTPTKERNDAGAKHTNAGELFFKGRIAAPSAP